MKHRSLFVLAASLLALFAAPAAAIDTFESYPLGLHTFEFYGLLYGQGADSDADKGYALVGGPAVGLGTKNHAYLFTGLSSNGEHLGGADFLNLGYFQNAWESGLDLDYWLEISAFGEGLSQVSRAVGLEANFDGPRGGLFWRGVFAWENDGDDAGGDPVIGRSDRFTYGLYWQSSPAVQIFADLVQERRSKFQSLADDSRVTSWAIGYNRVVSKETELIFEARAQEPPTGDRTWDFTIGWVVVWE